MGDGKGVCRLPHHCHQRTGKSREVGGGGDQAADPIHLGSGQVERFEDVAPSSGDGEEPARGGVGQLDASLGGNATEHLGEAASLSRQRGQPRPGGRDLDRLLLSCVSRLGPVLPGVRRPVDAFVGRHVRRPVVGQVVHRYLHRRLGVGRRLLGHEAELRLAFELHELADEVGGVDAAHQPVHVQAWHRRHLLLRRMTGGPPWTGSARSLIGGRPGT